MSLLRRYNRCVSSYPLLTLAMTSGLCVYLSISHSLDILCLIIPIFYIAGGMTAGNVLCQCIMYEKNHRQFSWKSAAQYAFFGFFISVRRLNKSHILG